MPNNEPGFRGTPLTEQNLTDLEAFAGPWSVVQEMNVDPPLVMFVDFCREFSDYPAHLEHR